MRLEALGRIQVSCCCTSRTGAAVESLDAAGTGERPDAVSARRVLAHTQDALIAAFATGSLLIVIPIMAERSKELLREVGGCAVRRPTSAVDLMVPINFNLPNVGKLLSLAFVLFAGWFSGNAMPADQYPSVPRRRPGQLLGKVVSPLPFLLDLMHIPADFFQLFLPVDTMTGRFGTLLAAVHTSCRRC